MGETHPQPPPPSGEPGDTRTNGFLESLIVRAKKEISAGLQQLLLYEFFVYYVILYISFFNELGVFEFSYNSNGFFFVPLNS